MNRHSATGMSSLDLLGDIPRGERVLLKIFLRNPTLSKEEYAKLVEKLPEKKNLPLPEIDKALSGLLKRGWLREDGGNYTLLQQRHRGSQEQV